MWTVEGVITDIVITASDLAYWGHWRCRPDVEWEDAYIKSGALKKFRGGR